MQPPYITKKMSSEISENLFTPSNSSDNECCICFENMTTNTITTRCNHIFHINCLGDWIDKNPTCPLCRRDISYLKINQAHENPGCCFSIITFVTTGIFYKVQSFMESLN